MLFDDYFKGLRLKGFSSKYLRKNSSRKINLFSYTKRIDN